LGGNCRRGQRDAEAELTESQQVTERRPGARQAGPASVPELALAPVLTVAALLALLLVAFSGRYGYHRDELYFLASGRHLAWGYPDQPSLVPLTARLMSVAAPGSLVVLRLPSAVASAALVVLTALLTRELGGGRPAQLLAAAAIAVSSVVAGSGHLLSTTTFDLPLWALLCWLVARILRTGQQRLWLVAGLVAGLALNNDDLVAFLIFAIVAGMAVAGPRAHLASPWFYAGGLIAALAWAPYLAWQAAHGWPELAVSSSIAAGGSGTSAPRWLILPEQLALAGPYLAPVWIAGLVRLLRDRALRWCAAFGVGYLVLAVVFIVTGGKPYYLAGMFPVLFAAGAEPTINWMRRGRARLRRGLVIAAIALSLTSIPVTLPVLPVGLVRDTPIVNLNYDAGETIGWPTFVREIAAVYQSLPRAQRAHAIVLASNYGEAGAVDRFGPAFGLPPAYSGHMAFWYWGPPPASADTVVAVGFGAAQLTGVCRQPLLAGHLNNRLGVSDQEQGAPVWVCQRAGQPWRRIWPRLRDFG
jgi:4-amino-4-deoxy-L-arabinose transferase-like glycosyltransferase